MNADLEALHHAKSTARDEWERLDVERNKARSALTEAERKARAALRKFERARLAYLEAVEGQEGA
jgi:uncharacterized protein (DUF3084 family)